MASIKIGGVSRELTFRKLSREQAREIEEITMGGMLVSPGTKPEDIQIPAINALRADELQVMYTAGITQQELDSMDDDDYQELKKAVGAWLAENKKK